MNQNQRYFQFSVSQPGQEILAEKQQPEENNIGLEQQVLSDQQSQKSLLKKLGKIKKRKQRKNQTRIRKTLNAHSAVRFFSMLQALADITRKANIRGYTYQLTPEE